MACNIDPKNANYWLFHSNLMFFLKCSINAYIGSYKSLIINGIIYINVFDILYVGLDSKWLIT